MSHTQLVQDARVKCCDRINGNEEKLAADKSRLVSVFQVKVKSMEDLSVDGAERDSTFVV